jgi:hypothetical protein
MPLQAFDPNGHPIDSQVGVTPLCVQLEPGVYQVTGSGFYVARYGLLLTAKHVVDEITTHDAENRPTVAWIWKSDGTLNFRPLLTCSFDNRAPRDAADIAICQAVDSAQPGAIRVAQTNERIALVTRLPEPDTRIATYAYPDNHRLDFRGPKQRTVRMFADAFEGKVLDIVGPNERFLRYMHVETSIQIRGGASGGPVFGADGHAFAVNCRGWDLGADEAVDPLSSVVPISLILDLEFPYPVIPPGSWEDQSVPPRRRGGQVSLRDLATWGHVSLDPTRSGT